MLLFFIVNFLNITINFSTIAYRYDTKKGDVFVQVFILFWFGSFLINLNNQMLGVVTSLFQCVCFLGYCMFPINLAAFLLIIVNINGVRSLYCKK